jgi:hypothetical protein
VCGLKPGIFFFFRRLEQGTSGSAAFQSTKNSRQAARSSRCRQRCQMRAPDRGVPGATKILLPRVCLESSSADHAVPGEASSGTLERKVGIESSPQVDSATYKAAEGMSLAQNSGPRIACGAPMLTHATSATRRKSNRLSDSLFSTCDSPGRKLAIALDLPRL